MHAHAHTDNLHVASSVEEPHEISAEACSGKDIAGLLRMVVNTSHSHELTKIVKSRVSGFSRAKLEAGRNGLGSCIARDESKSCCCVFSRPN